MLYILIGANAAIYLLAIIGIVRARLTRIPRVKDIEEAFKVLERALKASFPDLPKGFTWREVVTRLKSSGMEMDWWDIENTLRKYEAYKYGGIMYTDVNVQSVLRLAVSLPRGETYAARPQNQSSR